LEQPPGTPSATPRAVEDPKAQQPPANQNRTPRAASDPFNGPTNPTGRARDPFATNDLLDSPAPSTRELAARYRIARDAVARQEGLFRTGAISQGLMADARGRLEIARGQIEDMVERYRDELELLRVRLKRAQAEVSKAKGEHELSSARMARNNRLNDRIKGAISVEEMMIADREMTVAAGELDIREADVLEVATRIRQTERRLEALQKVLDEAKTPAEAKAPAGAPRP
jgi:multidrug resistance efflux pump